MTFLAGVAAGFLLAKSTATTGAMAAPARARDARTGEREEATVAPPPNDEQLRERIRARIGRTIANPEAIRVEVADGCVTLRGQVQARDAVLLMAEVEIAAGVQSVRNEMDVQGSLDAIAPPMTRDRPAVRAAEQATSRMS